MVSSEFVAEFGERWQRHVNERNIDGLLGMLAGDARIEDPRFSTPRVGREVARSIFEIDWRAFPDVRFSRPPDPYLISLEHGWAGARWHGEGTMRGPLDPPGYAATNRSFALDGIDLWQFRDGLASVWVGVYDPVTSARQLGLLPPSGSGAERLVVAMQRLTAPGHRLKARKPTLAQHRETPRKQ